MMRCQTAEKPSTKATVVNKNSPGRIFKIIFLLPLILAFTGRAAPGYALVGLGGGLIGLGGLLLSFLKAGKPILSRKTILKILPGLLLLTNAAFVLGFSAA